MMLQPEKILRIWFIVQLFSCENWLIGLSFNQTLHVDILGTAEPH